MAVMAKSGIGAVLACMMLVCMLIAASNVDAAITCGGVVTKLSPCISYLQAGGEVPPACCGGVVAVNNMAKTTPDRQAACGCLKTAAAAINGLQAGLIGSLPAKCGVSIPYKIGPSTDCSKVF